MQRQVSQWLDGATGLLTAADKLPRSQQTTEEQLEQWKVRTAMCVWSRLAKSTLFPDRLPVFILLPVYPFCNIYTRFWNSISKKIVVFLLVNTTKIRNCAVNFGGTRAKSCDFERQASFCQPILSLLPAHVVFDHCASWSLCYGAYRMLPRNRVGEFCRTH